MKVKRNEMDTAPDTSLLKSTYELIASDAQAIQLQLNYVKMPRMLDVRRGLRANNFGHITKSLMIEGGISFPRLPEAVTLFQLGKPQGRGIYHFANGDRYEGDINGGELNGQGTYFYGSGLKYEGEVRRGQPEGKGVFWFQDGSRFEGTFENGLARAKGEIVRADNTRSPAEIVDGNAKLLN